IASRNFDLLSKVGTAGIFNLDNSSYVFCLSKLTSIISRGDKINWILFSSNKSLFLDNISNSGSKRDTIRSEEHTSELQSRFDLVCRLLLANKNNSYTTP